MVIGAIVLVFASTYTWLNITHSDVDRLESNNCPVDGPESYTAIIVDQSEAYDPTQIRSIRQLFDAWLMGRPDDARVHESFNRIAFGENALLQLYVMNEAAIHSIEGLKPRKCVVQLIPMFLKGLNR